MLTPVVLAHEFLQFLEIGPEFAPNGVGKRGGKRRLGSSRSRLSVEGLVARDKVRRSVESLGPENQYQSRAVSSCNGLSASDKEVDE